MTASQIPVATEPTQHLHIGDALDILTSLSSASVDAVITDPPYAIKRPSKAAAIQAPRRRPGCTSSGCESTGLCAACLRVEAVARFAESPMLGQQSQNWHAKETHSRGYADNDPHEFQHWCHLWLAECLRILKPGGHLVAFGGTRTWHRLAAAAEDSGFEIRDSLAWLYSSGMPKSFNVARALTNSGNPEAGAAWAGFGTALKPAFEPIVLGRKPLDGTMVQSVTKWGVGPLRLPSPATSASDPQAGGRTAPGKWPCNVHIDDYVAHALDDVTGQDPARFFWVSKPNRDERVVVDGVAHPTVKPLDLMRHLVRLVTPDGGLVLDPFAGSGTTVEACIMEGCNVIAIERDPAFRPLIEARVSRRTNPFTDTPQSDDGAQRLF